MRHFMRQFIVEYNALQPPPILCHTIDTALEVRGEPRAAEHNCGAGAVPAEFVVQ